MDLERMLEKCRRDQWRAEDLDWTRAPRPMTAADERAIVQYFTDMAGIERLAAALFEEERKKASDPRLAEIFRTFVVDEERHAEVAARLARHYDVHRYQRYEVNAHLRRFFPHFVAAIRHLSPDIANTYVTTGELILDVALLRSLDDYVADETSHAAMTLINRDESRHIAVDFHMVEHYSSPEYLAERAAAPKPSVGEELRAGLALARMMFHARPFFRDVFFRPMALVDPSGRRLREAFKRIQLLGAKPAVRERPFSKFLLASQWVMGHPVLGLVFGRLVVRALGIDPEYIRVLYSDDEARVAAAMSFDELAEAALGAKYT